MRRPTVAVLTQSFALGSIIKMILGHNDRIRVVAFGTLERLIEHMRIAPADLVVCDYDLGASTAPEVILSLRQATLSRFATIVLAAHISRHVKQSCKFAQIDELIVKPASPLFLRERVEARLALAGRRADDQAGQRETLHADDNVVPLFGRRSADRRPAHP